MKAKILVAILVALLLLQFGAACSSQQPSTVSLDERADIPQVQPAAGDGSGNELLRVAIAGVLSPGRTLDTYQRLLAYMGDQLNREPILLQKPTYAEINDLVRGQHVDLAIVCSRAYVQGNREFGMELLVAPQVQGERVYYSYLIVSGGSNASSLEDLREAYFAFTDPLSNSGYLAPTYQLYLLGETPDSFFSGYVLTYSHDNSIMAVADGLVDGAAVDSLVYDQMLAEDPGLASKTRIIARWGPYGIPPVVVSPALDPQLKGELQELFLSLGNSTEGRSILDDLGFDRFVVVEDELYDSIREMEVALGW